VHEGSVDGTKEIALTVPVAEVNDFLKSLTVEDRDGGSVGVVRYGSREPVRRALASFSIDLSQNPTIATILEQARGETVEIVVERAIVGEVVSVTTVSEVVDGNRREIQMVTLNTDEGLQSFALDQARSVRFRRRQLQEELEQALATLARERQTETRSFRVQLVGTGRRRVRIGYVRKTPVWKTSYRLAMGNPTRLQAWAIVENTTGQDWNGVRLSLVTGAPTSFRMNLYDPVYITRPELPPPVRPTVQPQAYDQEIPPVAEPRTPRRSRSAAPMAESFGLRERAEDEVMDLSQGVREQAAARDLGASFAYEIREPVRIERFTSALVPIVNRTVTADGLSIYDERVLPGNPLLGAELSNTTGVHLMPGPITVYDAGRYAGDATIPDVPPGGTALLSYGVDLDVSVSTSASPLPEQIRTVRIVRGTLEASHVSRRTTTYAVVNRGRRRRAISIQHPKSSGWELITPSQPDAETESDYRFRVAVPEGERRDVTVQTERVVSRTYVLSNLSDDRLFLYIEAKSVDAAVRRALERIVDLQREVTDALEAQRAVEQEIEEIIRDQERIRANMESLASDSRLYERYVSTLDSQEDALEDLRSRLDAAKERVRSAGRRLDDYVGELTVG
jgi:hypothetical protein